MTGRALDALFVCCLLAGICLGTGAVTASGGGIPADADTALADGNDSAPFAEAGLDQTVPVGAVVYLDAYGSRAAEGSLTAYRWRIEHPNGTTISPACSRCEQTQFRPSDSGEYVVTLTVEDDAGRTATDTMYVTVSAGTAPNATLSGPDEMGINETVQFDLDARAVVGQLQSVEWYVDGAFRRGEFLDTDSVARSLSFAPNATGRHVIAAVVRNDNGTARTVRQAVTVRDSATFAVDIYAAPEQLTYSSPDRTATKTTQTSLAAGASRIEPAFTVTNTGSVPDTQTIAVTFPGALGAPETKYRDVTLAPGETRKFPTLESGSPVSFDNPFEHDVKSSFSDQQTLEIESETDRETLTVDVYEPPNYQVSIQRISAISSSQHRLEIRIENTGDRAGRQDIEYVIDPEDFYASDGFVRRGYRVSGGSSRSLTWTTDEFNLAVDDRVELRSDDDSATRQIPRYNGGGSGRGGGGASDDPKVTVGASDVKVGDYSTVRMIQVKFKGTTYSGSGFLSSDENNVYVGTAGDDKSFATDGGVAMRGDLKLPKSDADYDSSVRYKGAVAGTAQVCGEAWTGPSSDEYVDPRFNDRDSDCTEITVKPEDGDDGRERPGN